MATSEEATQLRDVLAALINNGGTVFDSALSYARGTAKEVGEYVDELGVAEEVLPLAQERGIATLIYVPFGRNHLWSRVSGRELPEWASEIGAQTWAQFFLKFIAAHPAVTAVTPATSKPRNIDRQYRRWYWRAARCCDAGKNGSPCRCIAAVLIHLGAEPSGIRVGGIRVGVKLAQTLFSFDPF